MPALHITKVAVGCASFDALEARIAARSEGDTIAIVTRFRPKRADELVGGSLFWIVKHRLVARQTILGFEERAEDRRTRIRLDAALVPVRAMPKRAHQGWRYLTVTDAPPDLNASDDLSALPAPVAAALAELALI